MTELDLTPLLRSTIGFDHLSKLLDTALKWDEGASYPPYNIEKLGENRYRIVMAVAGFGPEDLEVVAEPNLVTIRGRRREPEGVTYLHRGIAARAFERRFQLADYVRVSDARLENGLLVIELVREIPEALKPRRIEIRGARGERVIEHRGDPEAGSSAVAGSSRAP
ncbi:Small heat shock protein IbpA [bacterium HR40]|nr:Small heat shock protein IbpA [bacterium HR40]